MNLSELELKNHLKKELVGKNFGVLWECELSNSFLEFIKKQGLNEKDFAISRFGVGRRRAQGQTCYIVYKRKQEIGYIEVKKQKGTWESGYFGGGHYNWSFKDFGVVFYAKDFVTAVDDAKQRMIAKEDAETKMKNNAVKLLKVAKEKFGSDARDVIDYLKDNYLVVEKLANENR